MPRQRRSADQSSFLENYGHTAPAVPAIRQATQEWAKGGYKGATPTSKRLLNYWFHTDHKLPNGRNFKYHDAQREAIETLVYAFEIAQARTFSGLSQQFIPAELASKVRLPEYDLFARYCTKMATGSGKTKVMALALAWQYFNAVREADDSCARNFLIIAPNVIVFERLRSDFEGGRIFRTDPVIPKDMLIDWDMQCYMRGDAERASSLGALYLTNIQQLYEREGDPNSGETDIMTLMLGSKPPANLAERDDFRERLIQRDGCVMVINDEAHHTHDEKSMWNETIRALHDGHSSGICAQLDFSATPRYQSGALFAWTISDYTLKQAIVDHIVKRPLKGITDIGEVASDIARVKYRPFLVAAVERWREYRQQLAPLGKKPLLFVMMNGNDEADDIGEWLQAAYPGEFDGDKTLVIHTDRGGEISKKDLDLARKAAREVDHDSSPVNAIVSVLMLREGWDVQNVTVIVGLRPYTSKANILPEQTIGRGLRLMFRDLPSDTFTERVDIIGNKGFIEFVERLEKDEQVDFDTWKVGEDKLTITLIQPEAERAAFDITMPSLSPILARKSNISDDIEAIDVMQFRCPVLPLIENSSEAKRFNYEGKDILTLESVVARSYVLPEPQTAQEVIGFYARLIAQDVKLPGQFAALAPKVRDFLKYKAFGQEVDLDQPNVIRAISRPVTSHVTRGEFAKALRDKIVEPQEPVIEGEGRALSTQTPFPWSRQVVAATKTIFNQVPCDNHFEAAFARFLDQARDVTRFCKLAMTFGFTIPYTDNAGNLRYYYPDWVAADNNGILYLVETKGREDLDVQNKDRAAVIWAESVTALTGQTWQYVKVLQSDFEGSQPTHFADCVAIAATQPSMF
ncbi:MAG: DEAD/DEAH box helicase family protein [Anaerolineae bacterium]|nr:DEAD/DEAH box helicase family protein [Anaerolineae bacterium]